MALTRQRGAGLGSQGSQHSAEGLGGREEVEQKRGDCEGLACRPGVAVPLRPDALLWLPGSRRQSPGSPLVCLFYV